MLLTIEPRDPVSRLGRQDLQGHGDQVRFRNIWLVEPADRAAKPQLTHAASARPVQAPKAAKTAIEAV